MSGGLVRPRRANPARWHEVSAGGSDLDPHRPGTSRLDWQQARQLQAHQALSAPPGTVKPMTDETLATRIRTLRLQQQISQATAATTTGVHVTTWRAWESGTKRPRLERGGKIAQALNVPVAALFADDVVLAEVRALG